MATDSRTWFYTTPEPRPYYIEERVNHTLWKNRLQGLFMSCTQAANPVQMEGTYHDLPVTFEFQPGKYFTLRTAQEEKALAGVLRQILFMKPVLTYIDPDGMHVIEWHTDEGEDRWREIQGNPQYQGARRLRK
ncbi:MAG: hypothetical protein H6672_07220 [Anaerolineaceae bacterium]|nr:hypothetical protein [Anaerolineaceae bacterium]